MKTSFALTFFVSTLLSCSLWAQALHDPQADYPGSPEKPLTAELLNELTELNAKGEVFNAWKLLAAQKDGYAISAAKIFGDKITVGKCVVEGNWKIVVGEEVRTRLYDKYAQYYQNSYINFLKVNLRYPNSYDIERLYQHADDALGLPQSVSVDLLLNVIPADWSKRVFFDRFSSFVGVGRLANDKRWYDYTKLSKARVVEGSVLANDVTVEEAKVFFEKATAQVTKCMLKKLSLRSGERKDAP